MELSDHHVHNLNDAFGPDRLKTLPVSPDVLYDRINQTTGNPFYRSSGGRANLVSNLEQAFKDIDTYGEGGVDYLANLVAYAAWDTGGVDIFGRHWCADHGHRAVPSRTPTVPGQVRVAVRLSARTQLTISDFVAQTTIHQVCCPRTLSGDIETATLPISEISDWAQGLADEQMRANPDWTGYVGEGKGHQVTCCCLTEGRRPVDIISLESDTFADRYWKLLRAMRFEVRIADECHEEFTFDEDDPVPGHDTDTADMWRLTTFGSAAVLKVGGYEETLGDAETDLTGELTQLIGVLRR